MADGPPSASPVPRLRLPSLGSPFVCGPDTELKPKPLVLRSRQTSESETPAQHGGKHEAERVGPSSSTTTTSKAAKMSAICEAENASRRAHLDDIDTRRVPLGHLDKLRGIEKSAAKSSKMHEPGSTKSGRASVSRAASKSVRSSKEKTPTATHQPSPPASPPRHPHSSTNVITPSFHAANLPSPQSTSADSFETALSSFPSTRDSKFRALEFAYQKAVQDKEYAEQALLHLRKSNAKVRLGAQPFTHPVDNGTKGNKVPEEDGGDGKLRDTIKALEDDVQVLRARAAVQDAVIGAKTFVEASLDNELESRTMQSLLANQDLQHLQFTIDHLVRILSKKNEEVVEMDKGSAQEQRGLRRTLQVLTELFESCQSDNLALRQAMCSIKVPPDPASSASPAIGLESTRQPTPSAPHAGIEDEGIRRLASALQHLVKSNVQVAIKDARIAELEEKIDRLTKQQTPSGDLLDFSSPASDEANEIASEPPPPAAKTRCDAETDVHDVSGGEATTTTSDVRNTVRETEHGETITDVSSSPRMCSREEGGLKTAADVCNPEGLTDVSQ